MTILESLIYGIVAGVMTSALLFIASKAFLGLVIPWYQNLVYRGVRVDGAWVARSNGMNQSLHLSLHQAASKIIGSATLVSDKPSLLGTYEDVRSFSIVGAIRDRFVELSLRHDSQQRLGACCLLVEIVGDGRRMRGVFSFYSVIAHRIDSIELMVERKGLVQPPNLPNPEPELPLGLPEKPTHLERKKSKRPNQPVQPTPGTGPVLNLESPVRRG